MFLEHHLAERETPRSVLVPLAACLKAPEVLERSALAARPSHFTHMPVWPDLRAGKPARCHRSLFSSLCQGTNSKGTPSCHAYSQGREVRVTDVLPEGGGERHGVAVQTDGIIPFGSLPSPPLSKACI